MAVSARYWRVGFACRTGYTYAQLPFRSLYLADASGVAVAGATLAASGYLYNGATYPLTNLTDGNVNTICLFRFGYSENTAWVYVTYTYAAPVTVDMVIANVSSGTVTGDTLIAPNTLDFMVFSSTDNATWVPQSMLYRPVQTVDVDTRFAATTVSTIYPIPSPQNLGGSGGIYGIVSEDGAAVSNRPVLLFERDTFYKVGYTTTDENGGYAFNGLNESRPFMVMSYDPSGPPYKNALVWDRIYPINTKGAQIPVSSFFARRIRDTLGGAVAFSNYINGATYRYFQGNVLGAEAMLPGYMDAYDNFNFDPSTAVNGAIKFLKSNRTPIYAGRGLHIRPCNGMFSNQNAPGLPVNYGNLTFEYIFKAPVVGESSLIMVWSGTRDSDDYCCYGDGYNRFGFGGGPTLEVTTSVMNVRIPLSARNRATVRATAAVTPGAMYHVMVTYAQDTELKLYVNGVLAQTTALVGAGRIWACFGYNMAFDNWDGGSINNGTNAAMRRFADFFVGGTGNPLNVDTTDQRGSIPPGFGGALGFCAMYGRTFSQQDVTNYYDSYANPTTHQVLPTLSGYCAEVEADNPVYYFRLNELATSYPPTTVIGQRTYQSWYESTAVLNQTGFVAGSPSCTTTNGGAVVSDYMQTNSTFTVEFFCRPSTTAGTQRFYVSRIYNGNAPSYFSLVAGVLSLSVVDYTGTTATITFGGVTLTAGQPYHLAVTYDPWVDKSCKLYVNGALVSSQPATTIPNSYGMGISSGWLGIGTNPQGTAPTYSERFQGQMAEFAIYNYVVPASRIQAHYDARNA